MVKQVSGTLIARSYRDFRGVDFSNRKDEVSLYHSPDALNMWKNYKNSNGKCIETRPSLELLKEFGNTIYGLFFYTENGRKHRIVHAGTKLYDDDKVISSEMAEHKSNFFVMNNNLYILDTKRYLVYDGTELKEVEGFIPTTFISRSPSGGGTKYQDINLITPVRKNDFCSDGVSTEYMLSSTNLDKNSEVKVWIEDEEVTDFTVDYESGKVTFKTAPPEPLTVGADNVTIQYSKTEEGYIDNILKSTIIEVFDSRIFLAGNPDYPNRIRYCSHEDPTYFGDTDIALAGTTDSSIKTLMSSNNTLWAIKDSGANNTTIFYYTPMETSDQGKLYPVAHSSVSIGCEGKGINFYDDLVFFSNRGMEAITGDVATEQALSHRSSLVDGRLLNEANYKDMQLVEWEGYLLVIVGSKVYLADSRQMITVNDHNEYEWFYWNLDVEITTTRVDNGVLYLCGDKNVYTLTNTQDNREVEAYWCTVADEFKYSQYQKISNKKGCTVDMEGDQVTILVRTDNNKFELVDTFLNVKGYIIPRIKKKKWKMIQLKLSSIKPFSLYSISLEAYIGSYLKR